MSTGLYYAKISMIEANACEIFTLWHNRLGHPGTGMMRKLMMNSQGHTVKGVIPRNLTCAACAQGKLITRPSPAKVNKETLKFLERIQGDICGPIHPPSGTFRYFMVLIDASTRWSRAASARRRRRRLPQSADRGGPVRGHGACHRLPRPAALAAAAGCGAGRQG